MQPRSEQMNPNFRVRTSLKPRRSLQYPLDTPRVYGYLLGVARSLSEN
jgi:hypothetical protein